MNQTYFQTLEKIYAKTKLGINPGLERMMEACEILGNPQNQFPSIQIAGTNGKGSTAAMLTQVLMEAGYKVGLTVSPHLDDYRERLQINRNFISENDLFDLYEDLEKKLNHIPLTFYEWTILLAFVYFQKQKIDIAVLETGMGGRWDAVSVVHPIISAITNVSLDHQEFLGDTELKILEEKIQIIENNSIVWTGVEQSDLKNRIMEFCREKNAELNFVEGVRNEIHHVNLDGEFQKKNASLVWGISSSLKKLGYSLNDDVILSGLNKVEWKGRLEEIKPRLWMDGAHNLSGINEVVHFIKSKSDLKFKVYFSCLNNRPIRDMLKLLVPVVEEINLISFDYKQSFNHDELNQVIKDMKNDRIKRVIPINDINLFSEELCHDQAVIICGSIYFLGQLRSIYFEENQ